MSPIVKIFQKSENLPKICLIKCLKGHKSLGSLCSVVKTLIVSGNRPSKQPTKGQGHLLSCCGQLKSNQNRVRFKCKYVKYCQCRLRDSSHQNVHTSRIYLRTTLKYCFFVAIYNLDSTNMKILSISQFDK